ncbi:FecR family protein [Pseudomonas sp. Marseille-P9899]|uniref:FecR family protein n=1 Tax=Pseudomonas sp. Marseille-P9899 TaxID=2730401 RepID=UPI001589FD35|nr:FecR domain-containing protein [Pseudomonas sp. Marseille-P9899]
MTDTPPEARAKDPVWEAALDWLFRVQELPDDADLQQALLAWLTAAPEHQRAYRKAEKVWGLSGTVMNNPDFECPLPAAAPATMAAPAQLPSRRRRGWRRGAIGTAVAACALVVALLDWQGLGADYRSPTGEHREITLADGSVVELDSNSAIDVHFSADKRQVTLLRGQAFFDVKSQPERPFEVDAETVSVTVTGTAFAVEVSPVSIDVSVARGSVKVADRRHPANATEPLKPGQGLRFVREGGAVQSLQMPVEQIAAWRHWQMLAIDQPLSDVVARLRQYQPGLIVLNDAALGERRITAALDLRSPKKALEAAIAPLGARVTSASPYLLMVKAD